jgi:hypothetical protein
MNRIQIEPEFDEFVRQSGNVVIRETIAKSPTFQNADYFFPEDNIIAELKCLEQDKFNDPRTQEKLGRLWIKWRQRGDVSGRIPEIIHSKNLPDRCQKDMYRVYSNPIRHRIKKANRQIRETKKAMNLPDARGLLLIANDGNLALDPAAMVHILFESVRNNFSEIDNFVFFTANLFVRLSNPPKQSLIWFNGVIDDATAIGEPFIRKLFDGWSQHISRVQGVPIETVENTEMSEFWKLSHPKPHFG